MEIERSLPPQSLAAARWALLAGNFVIGCGVMVVGGTLNDLTRSLNISVTQGGHLIAIAAIMMGVGAPLLASLVAGMDRRRGTQCESKSERTHETFHPHIMAYNATGVTNPRGVQRRVDCVVGSRRSRRSR